MQLRGVVRHEVEDHLQAARVRGQRIEFGEIAEQWMDIFIVGDVVTKVRHRRGVDRRNPERIDAKVDEMIEPRLNAFQIADAVAIRILERARIDLIDDPSLPPAMCIRHASLLNFDSWPWSEGN